MTIWGIAMCIRSSYWYGFKHDCNTMYGRKQGEPNLNLIKRNPAAKKNNTTT